MDITKLSITELKALAYDALVAIETQQANVRVIAAEIAKKSKEQPKEE